VGVGRYVGSGDEDEVRDEGRDEVRDEAKEEDGFDGSGGVGAVVSIGISS
jgi:hypothetical protein